MQQDSPHSFLLYAVHNEPTLKPSIREYYHDKLAPASDVDLFIYGLGEQEAIEKIKQIEKCITESILEETTVKTFLKNLVYILSFIF